MEPSSRRHAAAATLGRGRILPTSLLVLAASGWWLDAAASSRLHEPPHPALPAILAAAIAGEAPEPPPAAADVPVLTLPELLQAAIERSPALAVSRNELQAVQAGIRIAQAYPNPTLEVLLGEARARRAVGRPGPGSEITVTQPIENPTLRRERIAGAEAGAAEAGFEHEAARIALAAEVRQRHNEVLRARAQAQAARDDLVLAEQILERIRVRVRSGEAPRFDQLRAETEVAGAQRELQAARARVGQALAVLRAAVAPDLPERFEVDGAPEAPLAPERIVQLRQAALARNPALRAAEAGVDRAARQVATERAAILPNVGLRVVQATEPDVRTTLAGVYLAVPLWDRREGQIRAAQERASAARAERERRALELRGRFDAASQGYAAASARLQAIQSGALVDARRAVEIAEAAYRLGERGVLEFLDALRVFRVVRNDLISARHELESARIELERLAGERPWPGGGAS